MENNIKLSITSPVGATLNTSGKYCDGDIEVIPYLQEKTVTESGEVLPDEGYAGLSKVMVDVQNSGTDTSSDTVTAETMLEGVTAHNASGEQITGTIPTYDGAMQDGLESYPKFQEKTATENGEVVPDEGFDGLSKVTVNVPSTGGGGNTKTPIVVSLINKESFTPYEDLTKISDEPLSMDELNRTVFYLHEPSYPGLVGCFASQEMLSKTYGEGSEYITENTILRIENGESELEGNVLVSFKYDDNYIPFLVSVTEDTNVFGVPKGTYIISELFESPFTLIIYP